MNYQIVVGVRHNNNTRLISHDNAIGAWVKIDRGNGYENIADLHLPPITRKNNKLFLITSEGQCLLPFKEIIEDPTLNEIRG